MLSLVFKESFDGIAAANYIGIVVLELGIFGCYLVLNPKAARRRLQEQEQQQPEADSASIGAATAGGQDIEQATHATGSTRVTPDWSRQTTLDEKPSTPVQQRELDSRPRSTIDSVPED